jgi:PKD repeat protein
MIRLIINPLFILGVFVLSVLPGTSQPCGTEVTVENLEFLEKMESLRTFSSLSSTTLVRVPIQFHYIVQNAGQAPSSAASKRILDQLNNYFRSSSIEFFIESGNPNIIVDPDSYDFDGANEGTVAINNDIRGAINIYFSNTLVLGGSRLCGYTRFPPSSDRVFVAYGCVLGGTTLEHELGHYFTLFHTHGTTNTGTTDELVSGSNCSSAGDRLCDTPADPNLSGNVGGDCIYTANLKDVNGDFYKPDVTNIMSYAPDACVNKMSGDQYLRIRNGFENGRSYLRYTTDGFLANFRSDQQNICLERSVSFQSESFGAANVFWEFEGGTPRTSSLANPVVSYQTSGVFDVSLKATSNSGEVITVLRNDYVNVIDPLEDADVEPRLFEFVGSFGTLKTINPDLGYGFEYSNSDSRELSTSGSAFVNNYLYESNTIGSKDALFSQYFNGIGVAKFDVSFKVAYRSFKGGLSDVNIVADRHDSLAIYIETICGQQPLRIWQEGGRNLSKSNAISEEFFPETSEWLDFKTSYTMNGADFAKFYFQNISYNGNNLFIDDIAITPDYSLNKVENLNLVSSSANSVLLRWIDNSNPNALGYVVEKSVDGTNFSTLDTLGKQSRSFVDKSFTSVGNFDYRVYALGFGDYRSDYSDVVSLTILSVNSIETEVSIYPNPTSNHFIIKGISTSTSIRAFSVAGAEVDLIRDNENNYSYKLPSNVKTGIIFVHISEGNKSTVKKLVIK